MKTLIDIYPALSQRELSDDDPAVRSLTRLRSSQVVIPSVIPPSVRFTHS